MGASSTVPPDSYITLCVFQLTHLGLLSLCWPRSLIPSCPGPLRWQAAGHQDFRGQSWGVGLCPLTILRKMRWSHVPHAYISFLWLVLAHPQPMALSLGVSRKGERAKPLYRKDRSNTCGLGKNEEVIKCHKDFLKGQACLWLFSLNRGHSGETRKGKAQSLVVEWILPMDGPGVFSFLFIFLKLHLVVRRNRGEFVQVDSLFLSCWSQGLNSGKQT